ncbi:hypothetical protein CS549_00025 [Porphyromonas gingivalis]|nr:hypothetical protein CS549_00025 [Porphyromonas gingivalis]
MLNIYKNMSKTIIYIILCTLCLFSSCRRDTNSYKVKIGNINESIYASGIIKPKTYVTIRANITDYINKIYVKEGEIVDIGDTLFITNIKNELSEIHLIKEQIDNFRDEISDNSNIFKSIISEKKKIKDRLELSRKNVLRYRKLLDIQAVSQKSYEESVFESEQYEIEYLNVCSKYFDKKNEFKNNIINLEKEYFKASSLLKNKIILSPIAGKIYHIEKKEGDYIEPGISILTVAQGDDYILELLVDERDISKVREKQNVLFKTEILDSVFEAKIESINPVFDMNSRSFKVKASLSSNYRFFPESFIEANIIIREEEKAIIIPSEYLLKGDIVLKNELHNKTQVKVGMRNSNWCEIISGLDDGDVVYVKK